MRAFDRDLLPNPVDFYTRELHRLKFSGNHAQGCCPFHDDTKPSLSINLATGAYKCFACGASGGNVLDFTMQLTGDSFIDAVTDLRAWAYD